MGRGFAFENVSLLTIESILKNCIPDSHVVFVPNFLVYQGSIPLERENLVRMSYFPDLVGD